VFKTAGELKHCSAGVGGAMLGLPVRKDSGFVLVNEHDYRWPRTARNFFTAQARFSADGGRIPNILCVTL